MKSVLTGVAGQDGSYLSELLLSQGHQVIGVDRRRVNGRPNLDGIKDEKFSLVEGDIVDSTFITHLIATEKPDYFYNCAAMSHVGQSFKQPAATFDVDAKAVLLQLDAIRLYSPKTRYYHASTSELFGGLNCPEEGYDESSPMYPRSPYGVAKLAAYWFVKNYREAYGIHAVTGVLFNHESPRRSIDFVTRKITSGVADIYHGKSNFIELGNLDSVRDWGHAKDYIKAMQIIVEADKPVDYVVATGVPKTIRDLLSCAFKEINVSDWSPYVRINSSFLRPSEVPYLLGNSIKIQKELGWQPEYSFEQLISEMVKHDLGAPND